MYKPDRDKNIPRNESLCKNCSANEIEDEAHFLIKCDKLNNKTEELFKLISSKVKNSDNVAYQISISIMY
jgi:hypothetical protein